ncbi:hypothetical protein AAE478_002924 [Parahypoxylon ruwenzoriense]
MLSATAVRLSALVLTAAAAAAAAAAVSPETPGDFGPSLGSARENAPQIFNAVHNAMCEFGSALDHNGMSLFPAVVPEGVLLYHGTHTTDVPTNPEWLAFEIEHAEAFARIRMRPAAHPGFAATAPDSDGDEDILNSAFASQKGGGGPPEYPPFEPQFGYLHVYQAARALNLLYIDGTAAGKTDMGTLDTQDLLLADRRNSTAFDERGRARDLCAQGRQWGIDGFIRMEPGFEIIYCDFASGLRLISTRQRPDASDGGVVRNISLAVFEWARAAAQRYRGIGGGRVRLDYSAAVSAFFYPLNLTNPDATRPDLPRLSRATDAELRVLRRHVGRAVARSLSRGGRGEHSVDWQGVTDMIVTRYADGLGLLAQADSLDTAQSEVNNLLNLYIDYAEPPLTRLPVARQRCASFFLQPVRARTPEDELIAGAIETTTAAICGALFRVRELVVEDASADASSLEAARRLVRDLMETTLRWPEWKECGACAVDEVCFVAMWPWGAVEDHFSPSCLNFSTVAGRRGYWRMPEGGPGRGKRPPPPPPPSSCVEAQRHGQPCGGNEDGNDLPSEEL